ncbi:CD8A protein, partial [Aegotheles bennettii]|nr:CD8A protein [Aegotheles bennettii]
ITHPRVGQQLELQCETTKEDTGVSWVRQDKGGTLHFIVFTSFLSKSTFAENLRGASARFEARKDSKFYQLVVKSFTTQDEGNYFCLMNSNQELYFSPGQPAFFPVTTTAAPTTAAPSNQHSITQTDPCPKSPDSETGKENFACDFFIWIPLSGACLLLLIALAITIVMCQRTRRRRCRCRR